MTKSSRVRYSKIHTARVAEEYKEEIEHSINNSRIYSGDEVLPAPTVVKRKVTITNLNPVKALAKYAKGKTVILNFGNYNKPAGGYTKGEINREITLCRNSDLFPILRFFDYPYYENNRVHPAKQLYHKHILYTPEVVFEVNDSKYKCDVLNCAAPNWIAAQRQGQASFQMNYAALSRRIKFIAKVLSEQKVDTVILGAFGCLKFGQDPRDVAELFDTYIQIPHCIIDIPEECLEVDSAFRERFGGV